MSGVAQSGGLQIHPNALEPKFTKLNPVTNLGNLFSSAIGDAGGEVAGAGGSDGGVGVGRAEGVDVCRCR